MESKLMIFYEFTFLFLGCENQRRWIAKMWKNSVCKTKEKRQNNTIFILYHH